MNDSDLEFAAGSVPGVPIRGVADLEFEGDHADLIGSADDGELSSDDDSQYDGMEEARAEESARKADLKVAAKFMRENRKFLTRRQKSIRQSRPTLHGTLCCCWTVVVHQHEPLVLIAACVHPAFVRLLPRVDSVRVL